ncbi:bactericidal permeability-increasing protein-like [Argopecten irradians]|uniref:bactericidal permeability-increasing protein-like n=1 Tax=Argopecten irradians TaxID=31199 RepID=UPI003723644B
MAVRASLLFCVFVSCIGIVTASHDPLCGLKLRITTSCLNYANKVMIDKFLKKTRGGTIKPIENNSNDLYFKLEKIYVKELSVGHSSVTMIEDKGIQWSARGISISVSAHYRYKYTPYFLHIEDDGGIDGSVFGGLFDVRLAVGIDSTRRPRVRMDSCNCAIDRVKVKFSGGISSMILNLFRSLVEDYLKKILKSKVCDAIRDTVDRDLEKSLHRAHISSKIGPKFLLDYGLQKSPVFNSDSMETFHKGIIYCRKNITQVPFQPSPFPPVTRNDKMIYAWVSGYMFRSLTYQAQRNGVLHKTLTNDDFLNSTVGFLSTSCKFGKLCIGKFLPQLQHQFPREVVEIELKSRKAPNIILVDGQLRLIMNGSMTLFVKPPTAAERKYLFTMDADMASSIKVSYSDGYLHSNLGKMNFNICISNSTLHPIYDRALNFIMQNIVKHYVKPALDSQGSIGLPLLKSDDIKLVNTNLTLTQDAIIIGTDLQVIEI